MSSLAGLFAVMKHFIKTGFPAENPEWSVAISSVKTQRFELRDAEMDTWAPALPGAAAAGGTRLCKVWL